MKRVERPHYKPGRNFKLTRNDAELIRALKGELTSAELAEKMEVSRETVKSIWCGRLWNSHRMERA